jgi:GWxTD domain-containing protein
MKRILLKLNSKGIEEGKAMNTRNSERRFRLAALALGLAIVSILATGCHLYNLERNLKPADADFLSKVRYIITGEERKTFLELPDADKPKFIEDFWKRRNPDPDSQVNEFKVEYFNRVQKATELFHGEGMPGWLTDRGRIYILFGPPLDRITNPASLSGRERCTEVWYYGQFPVVFVDENCTGNYVLVTYDLTSLREQNIAYMSNLAQAQSEAEKTIQPSTPSGKPFFDFSWDVEKTTVTADRLEGRILVDMPLARIWFKAVGNALETVVDIEVELRDSKGKVYWEHKESLPLSTTEEELKRNMKGEVRKEIPFVIDKDLDLLRAGKNQFVIRLKNNTGNETVRKTSEFSL